jgi:hypothetical protein
VLPLLYYDSHGLACRSRRPVQLAALLTEAFELWFIGGRYVNAVQADKPTSRARQHRSEILAQNAIWAANDLVSHFEPFRSFAFRIRASS